MSNMKNLGYYNDFVSSTGLIGLGMSDFGKEYPFVIIITVIIALIIIVNFSVWIIMKMFNGRY